MVYHNREIAKKIMYAMSTWQFHLFTLRMAKHAPENLLELLNPTWRYLIQNPLRIIMYIAMRIGLKPWLWFGVTK